MRMELRKIGPLVLALLLFLIAGDSSAGVLSDEEMAGLKGGCVGLCAIPYHPCFTVPCSTAVDCALNGSARNAWDYFCERVGGMFDTCTIYRAVAGCGYEYQLFGCDNGNCWGAFIDTSRPIDREDYGGDLCDS